MVFNFKSFTRRKDKLRINAILFRLFCHEQLFSSSVLPEVRIVGVAHSFVVLGFIAGMASITLLNEGELETLTLGERDEGLLALTDDHNVAQTGSEGVTAGVTDVSDVVGTGVSLDVGEDTDTTNVVTTVGHDGGTVLEFDETVDLTSLQVQL